MDVASEASAWEEERLLKPVLRLAGPVVLEQLLNMLVAFVDQWLAGRALAPEHLAAIGLIWYVLWFIPALLGGLAIGATAVVARSIGARRPHDAVHATNQALLTGFFFSVLLMVVLAYARDPGIALMQLEPEAGRLAARYINYLLPILPLMMVEQVGIACLRGAGDTVSGFIAMTVLNLVNAAVGIGLVMGLGPLPRWGWDGLALGTACGHACGALVVLAMLIGGRAGLRLEWRLWRPDREMIGRLLRVGVPGGFDMTSNVLCHSWFLSIINALGTLPAAAHGVAIRIESLAYLPGTAFQVAAATLAGQHLGAANPRRAVGSVLAALAVCGGIMVSAGLMFFFAAEPLTNFFLGPQTREAGKLAAPLLRVVAFSMPSLAILTVLVGALRGAGDTVWTLIFTFVGLLGVRIPLAYYLAWDEIELTLLGTTIPALGLGLIGAWYAMVADLVARSVIVSWRFFHGGWKSIRV